MINPIKPNIGLNIVKYELALLLTRDT